MSLKKKKKVSVIHSLTVQYTTLSLKRLGGYMTLNEPAGQDLET